MRTLLLVAALLAAACDHPPEGDQIKEWTPQDHDQAELQGRQGMAARVAPGAEDATRVLADVAWNENCAVCHGPLGHGDGPNGALVRAPDLAREEWQARVSDGEIAAQIRNGKGLMPKFELPDASVRALVARIRAVRGR